MSLNHLQFQVAIGTIAVTWTSQGLLSRIDWYYTRPVSSGDRPEGQIAHPWSALSRVEIPPKVVDVLERMRLYFQSGEPIGEIPWDMIDQRGWSDFQAGVYRELTAIPHGETRTYAWISRRLGKLDRPAAPRAVGQALKRNPLPILIPCHRVCSEGGMGGFMGIADPEEPELQLKRWLIELETNYRNPVFCFLGAGVPLGFELSRAGATG